MQAKRRASRRVLVVVAAAVLGLCCAVLAWPRSLPSLSQSTSRQVLAAKSSEQRVVDAGLLRAGRAGFPAALNHLELRGVGVEIGVQEAIHAEHILRQWAGRRLVLVDPWAHQDKRVYTDGANRIQEEQERIYETARQRVAPFADRVSIMRRYSVDAANEFENSSLDFIYIDARHDYEGAREDLQAWYPKLREGGLFAGHDYIDRDLPGRPPFFVKRAVDEFAQQVGRVALQTECTPDCPAGCTECMDSGLPGVGYPSWWWIK
eukprot:tig00000144_g9161.t1